MYIFASAIFSCVNEWNLAVKLHESGVCKVIVSAFGVVSRPAPLKNFVYLDFMDKTKRDNVMVKLQLEIGMCVGLSIYLL